MSHSLLAITFSAAALLGSAGIAQAQTTNTDGGGLPPAATKPATDAEKAAAKNKRYAEGKGMSNTNTDGAGGKPKASKAVSKEEKDAARAKRIAEGKGMANPNTDGGGMAPKK